MERLLYQYAGRVIESRLVLPELLPAVGVIAQWRVDSYQHKPSTLPTKVAWQHTFRDAAGTPALACARTQEDYQLEFPGIARIHADCKGNIGIEEIAEDCAESIRHVLLDQALPRLLAQCGELVLHAAMVRTRSGATLLLLGESGRGKSTLTGAMLASGHDVLTDDGAILEAADGAVLARRTYPSVRLLPDSLEHLFPGRLPATLPMAHYSHKRRLPLLKDSGNDALPVDAFIVLGDPMQAGTPALTAISPGASCLMMMRHGFQLDLSDAANVSQLLGRAAFAARQVPTYQLDYARDYSFLPKVIGLLDDTFR